MSVILLIIALVFFFICSVIPFNKYHGIIAFFFLVIATLSGVSIVANDTYHYGMKVKTTTTRYQLVSASDKMNVLLYQPLGNGSEKVYLYKTSSKQKIKPMKTKDSSAKYVITSDKPNVTVTEKRYVYKDGLSKFFFGILHNNNELKHCYYTFNINRDWNVLTAKQAKELDKLVKKNQAALKSQVETTVKAKVAAAMQANPQMSAEQQKELIQQAQNEATQAAIQKLIQSVKEK